MPNSWTPDQIRQFQDYWDTEFAGDLARRRRAKFVPGDTAARVVQTKEPDLKDDFDEWLARIVCFAFSIPPQWAVKAMNRATADNQSAQSEEEGLEPTKEWVKELIDEIIAEEFASPDLELHWLDEDDGEPETVLADRVKLGALTLNEMRSALGLDPYANPAADRPMALTATGYVPIEANANGSAQGSDAAGQEQGLKTDPPSAGTSVSKAAADDPKHPGWPAGTPGGSGGKFRPKDGGLEDEADRQVIPVVDFSGGLHGALVDAWMELFKKEGYPAVKELSIRLIGSEDVYGRLDILAKLPICVGVCVLEMKTGVDPTFTEKQRIYIPMLLLGGHVYSTDDRIKDVGLVPGLPFPPMPVFVIWSKPGEVGYRAFKLLPKRDGH